MTEEQIIEMESKRVRKIRNELLAECDWWAVSDRLMSQEEVDYREALRDITDQESFPFDIIWPTKPE